MHKNTSDISNVTHVLHQTLRAAKVMHPQAQALHRVAESAGCFGVGLLEAAEYPKIEAHGVIGPR